MLDLYLLKLKNHMMDAEITVIGAGVVGLAISEKLSGSFKNLFLIEKHSTFGQETSSRNSEVIHAGIRPKLQRPGGPVVDFYIAEESARGFPGFINLIGIESPGLTASLAIADHVSNTL